MKRDAVPFQAPAVPVWLTPDTEWVRPVCLQAAHCADNGGMHCACCESSKCYTPQACEIPEEVRA